jgi:hypothetical protein
MVIMGNVKQILIHLIQPTLRFVVGNILWYIFPVFWTGKIRPQAPFYGKKSLYGKIRSLHRKMYTFTKQLNVIFFKEYSQDNKNLINQLRMRE